MPKITEIYAFVTEDTGPDDEGMVGMQLPGGNWMPLVGADMARIDSLMPSARAFAKQLGKPVKLVHFSQRKDVLTL